VEGGRILKIKVAFGRYDNKCFIWNFGLNSALLDALILLYGYDTIFSGRM
jgi:hypothetical protein